MIKNFMRIGLIIYLLTFSLTFYAQNYNSMHKQEYEYYKTKQLLPNYYETINKSNFVQRSKSTRNCNLNKIVFGWHPYWMNGLEANYDWNLLSDLSYFGYNVNPNTGNANSTYNWATAAVVDSALANGVRVNLCVTLFSDHATFFGSSTSQQTLITNLINLIQQRNANGVNIDFEEVSSTQKAPLTNFIINLSTQMKTAIPNAQISIALPAVDWSGTFDVVAMLPHIDLFLIMGYDYYYSSSSQAGPTDPLYTHVGTYDRNLSRSITYYLSQGIPSGKLALGLPYYGREWETVSNTVPSNNTGNFTTSRTYKVIKDNVNGYYSNPVYYHKSESTYHIYQIGGKWRQCFINDANTLGKRYDMVNQRQLAGIGIWALGYDDGYSDLWDIIENKFTNCATVPCQGTIYDLGGPEGNYYPNENLTYKISPTGATNLSLMFNSFNLGSGDTLKLFNGANIHAPLIGNYTGNNSPGTIASTGNAITLSFKSSAGATASGWEAVWQCMSDITPPQTEINISNTWKTANFVANFTDTDNQGGSGIDRRFYQVSDFDGTHWRANAQRGFFVDDFQNLSTAVWTVPSGGGTWNVQSNALVQSDLTLTNTNIYAELNQTLSNRYMYQFSAKAEGATHTDGRRFGLHFFSDNGALSNRGNSYFVWFRIDDSKMQIYKVTNNNFTMVKEVSNVTVNAGTTYDFKIIYDRITGEILVYKNNVFVGSYTDPQPFSSNGNYISFRTGNSKLTVNDINVFRTRAATANITVGANSDIRYQNPSQNTSAARIKSIVSDAAKNLSTIVSLDINVDWSPPSAVANLNDGTAADIDTTSSTSSLSANWTAASDPNSNIQSYWYAIGTSPGDSNVVAWTNNATALTVTKNGLSLSYNTTYYFSVKAKNNAGLFGIPINSDGVLVVNPTITMPLNMQTTVGNCPQPDVTFSWTNSGSGWQIHVADNASFNNTYIKWVSNLTNYVGPSGFVLQSDGTTPLVLNEGQSYFWKIKYGSSFTGVETFIMPVCSSDTLSAPEICFVTVENNHNRIIWEKPVSAIIDSFYIYRETNVLNQYEKIGTVAYENMSIFDDINSTPLAQSYGYKISLININGVESQKGNPHRTMHLAINQGMDNTWNLIWTPYQGIAVITYNIYRGTTPDNLQQINSLSGTNSQFTDSQAPLGILYYQVEFILPYSCDPSKSYNSSRSNLASNDIVGVENTAYSRLNIYPNPVSNTLYIETENEHITSVEIWNITGQLLKNIAIPIGENRNIYTIDVSDLNNGVYVLKLTNNLESKMLRFVKNND